MKLVDAANQEVGLFFFPMSVGMQVGEETVFTSLDIYNRTFSNEGPTFYFTSDQCKGTSLMYVNLSRYGWVNNGMLFYPTGPVTVQPFNSYLYDGTCERFEGGSGPLAATGMADLSIFAAPFSVQR